MPVNMPVTMPVSKGIINNYSGFTLIEVLVTVIILAVGLLGVANMQILGLTYNQNAYYRSQATQLANAMVERMRLNPDGVADGNYSNGTDNGDILSITFHLSVSGTSYSTTTPTLSSAPDCEASRCDTGQLANYDIINWQNDIMAVLPKPEDASNNPLTTASITFYTGNRYTIIITWGEKQEGTDNLLANNFVSRNVTLYIQL